MAISFHPKAGMILVCDFSGYVVPEIVKTRPVVIVSPDHLVRPGLCTVVPLSTTPPSPIRPYHYKFLNNPLQHESEEVWAKCDLIASVSVHRLDRVKVARGTYRVFHVSTDQLKRIRVCAAISLGLDFGEVSL